MKLDKKKYVTSIYRGYTIVPEEDFSLTNVLPVELWIFSPNGQFVAITDTLMNAYHLIDRELDV